jgi:hypothetical protein
VAAYSLRGNAYEKTGEHAKAEADFAQAKKFGNQPEHDEPAPAVQATKTGTHPTLK